jgi:phthiocerol/phenolphthiocerol synthesis type-I polyketide synthase C
MHAPHVHRLRSDIAVVGWACRLPGANSIAELWSLLLEGRCAVSKVPADRFPLDKFGHPRRQEKGKSYTWAAGILDDIWGFDPTVFGISPREAVQIDPQQRILLQLTWEALEDAGIPPSSIANTEVGVFVGASQTDYGHAFFGDPAIADAHFAPGTALAILANRISYIYNLQGPSITVDTACSSSLVALHQAVEALRSGRIETAIVAGSNLIASPASFIAFSQANMLSPNGLCQTFSANADGFVRAEGAIVLILRNADLAQIKCNPIHGIVLATEVNSDGRTNGISLPSLEAQENLLDKIYARNGIDFDQLAFVEAHGTGTPVGDPIEANAIGRIIGRHRTEVLPIGSIKTNIGHLEPASGLAGVLKALLALNHGILPPSLHFKEPNPYIKFEELNLSVCTQPLLLPNATEQLAGVNSFGFGGTNSHTVLAAGRKSSSAEHAKTNCEVFNISASSGGALNALALEYASKLTEASDSEAAMIASAAVHRREQQIRRIVVTNPDKTVIAEALNAFVTGTHHPDLTAGTAVGQNMPITFVYSGNGGQWVGMGVSAYRNSERFRARFDQVDLFFKQISGWSLKEVMFSESLPERLPLTSTTQPLIFAIQVASTEALKASGLRPAAVLGHSVGEIAAAEAAGILDLRTAVKVIHFRSMRQESRHGLGRMAAVLSSAESVQPLLDKIHGVELAAINSPRAVTVAGSREGLYQFKDLAKKQGIALLDLDLEYPFHTALMAPIEQQLKFDLRDISPHEADVPFVSTVTGTCVPGSRLDARYWWRNIREPVRFLDAIQTVAELGVRYFVEVGPRPVLLKHITDSLQDKANRVAAAAVLDRDQDDFDPFAKAYAKAMVAGAQVNINEIFGPDPGPAVDLPRYPWQQTAFRFRPTVEAIDNEPKRHPFAGARASSDAVIWRSHIDTALYPQLTDHKLGDQVIFPGTGFVEIALAVAKEWLQTDTVVLNEFEIMNPLDLSGGETREIMTRVSPGSGTLEIFSRPRLSQASWLMHCRTKIQTGNSANSVQLPNFQPDADSIFGTELYELASASGLNYGPAFRLVERANICKGGEIEVELAKSSDEKSFLLDPMRVDASAHGFFTVFPEVCAIDRGVTYIPVRLQQVALYHPYLQPVRALIKIFRKSARFIVGDCYVLAEDGAVIAVLRGVRSQAISMRRTTSIASTGIIESLSEVDGRVLGQTGVGTRAKDLVAFARTQGFFSNTEIFHCEAEMLLEGWALSAATEIALRFARNRVVDIEELVIEGRLPERLRAWATNVLYRLEAAGLANRQGEKWEITSNDSLPRSGDVIKALLVEHPSRSAEALLASAIDAMIGKISSRNYEALTTFSLPTPTADFYHSSSVELRVSSELIYNLLCECRSLWPEGRSLRILQIGFSQFTRLLLKLRQEFSLTVLEPDPRRFENASLDVSRSSGVRFIDGQHLSDLEEYDLIVSGSGLHRLPAAFGMVEIRNMLAPRGLLIAVEPETSLFKEFIFGLEPDWFMISSHDAPQSRLHRAENWSRLLEDSGFQSVQAISGRAGDVPTSLIVAEAAPVSHKTAAKLASAFSKNTRLVIAAAESAALSGELLDSFAESEAANAELSVSLINSLDEFPVDTPTYVIFLPSQEETSLDPLAALTKRCFDIKVCAEKIGNLPAHLWLIFSGAVNNGSSAVRPVETGAWAFARTLANEFPKLDVRKIDIDSKVPIDVVARVVSRIVLSGTSETELVFDGRTLRAVRVQSLDRIIERKIKKLQSAARLERRSAGHQRLSWQPIDRKPPDAGEVEIGVEVVGTNFRDLMFSLGLLPEDMLENGFSGPTLGLECVGRIIRVGEGVTDIGIGARVMAFAASSFATHVTVPRHQVVALPEKLSTEAAATIPVAFFTAYYSLISQANLKRREWVLIHGGAGAVGMAALQIAQWKKAKIIATAGSPAKRKLLRSLGAHHVLDSRSMTFVDDVLSITGGGVDVVLNSLAGEAMERSIGCLRPFGRFLELGKRDYVTNTHIGLRPFRRNLSYFGIDVDQVIGAHGSEARKIFAKIIQLFNQGKFAPLPYSVFDADHVDQAFHLMQQSSHVGKILVRPPSSFFSTVVGKSFVFDPEKTHVVTGAFGGFGLETAKWLVDKGVRYLVLIGRNGPATPETKAALKSFSERGVKVIADPCDVTDLSSLQSLFQTVSLKMPPVAGVIHEAMVLDDAILANLNEERFKRVLAPKVIGADNLDYIFRNEKLDYFVLFSSVTTLIGNPGQANYVAANSYMEGLARLRRSKGLPALAIGWGPIVDVGVVAQSEKLRSGLQKLAGIEGLYSRDALKLMVHALSQPPDIADTAAITILPTGGGFTAQRLAVLRSPTYTYLLNSTTRAGGDEIKSMDLHALAASEGFEMTRQKVVEVVTTQLAHVLHLREEDISRVRPLSEVGVDSLMALELVMNLEECFNLKIPLSGSMSGMTVADIAKEVMAHVGLNQDREDTMVEAMVVQHQEEFDPQHLKALKGIMTDEKRIAKRLLS